MDQLKNLEQIITPLKNPADYYSGIPFSTFDLPRNVLLFTRRSTRELGIDKSYHHRYVFIINCRGEGQIILGSKMFNLKPGGAVLAFPHQFHHYIMSIPSSIFWIFITFELPVTDSLITLKDSVFSLSDSVYDYLASLISLYAHVNRSDKSDAIKIELLLALVLEHCVDENKRAENRNLRQSSHSHIDRIHQYIHAHIDKQFTLNDLSSSVALSESHCRMIYKKEIGIGLGTYIRELRLRKATSLLHTSGMNISEIAYACGYESVFAFSRAFRSWSGKSPKIYRKAILKNEQSCS